MPDEEPREITRPVWYGDEEGAPEIPEGSYGIAFTTVPAEGASGDTVALLGTARLGLPHSEMYGSRIGAATEIVALDPATGHAYHQRAARMDSAPFQPVIHPPGALDEMEAVVDETEAHFNADLATHLGLPQESASYQLFCWLDDLVSDMQMVEMPASEERPTNEPLPHPADVPEIVSFEDAPAGVTGGGIPLRLQIEPVATPDATPEDRIRLGVWVQGHIGPDLLPEQPPAPDDDPLWLTVLVRSHLDREVCWRSAVIPIERIEQRSVGFRFQPFRMLDLPESPQRHFALATVGGVLSEVLVIEPEELASG
jgi:hypothetical protein